MKRSTAKKAAEKKTEKRFFEVLVATAKAASH
jgi:hypothetical protein